MEEGKKGIGQKVEMGEKTWAGEQEGYNHAKLIQLKKKTKSCLGHSKKSKRSMSICAWFYKVTVVSLFGSPLYELQHVRKANELLSTTPIPTPCKEHPPLALNAPPPLLLLSSPPLQTITSFHPGSIDLINTFFFGRYP